jgi:glycosyltransferase involved in cell wall biosynthesis
MTAKFSIAIPVYNRSDYLRQAVASCLAQAVSEFEIIISDDCSSEDLSVVAKSFDDRRIAYHRSEMRLGATANHQRAVELSKAAYVVVLNSDDMLLPNCLETAGRELDNRPHAAAVYFSCTYLEAGRISGASPMPAISFADRAIAEREAWLEQFSGTSPSCCMFRRSIFDRLGGYRTFLRFAYDWDLYKRFLVSGGGVVFLPEILCIYRRHTEQMVQAKTIDGLWDVLDLWSDNPHWTETQLADLVLTQGGIALRSQKARDGITEMISGICGRKVGLRLLRGVPGAIYGKARRRIGASKDEQAEHYVRAKDPESAICEASITLRACIDAANRLNEGTYRDAEG